ncbi:MAG: hypothetical protein U0936_08320 [Planctomycetaceae bacterium]
MKLQSRFPHTWSTTDNYQLTRFESSSSKLNVHLRYSGGDGQLKRIGENEMDHKAVEKLESKLEDAIAEVFKAMGKKKIPLVPDHHTENDG